MTKTEQIEVSLEYVNTQIGHLVACIQKRKDKKEDVSDLEKLLDSMKSHRQGLKSGTWPPHII
jgi:hypothetical protein